MDVDPFLLDIRRQILVAHRRNEPDIQEIRVHPETELGLRRGMHESNLTCSVVFRDLVSGSLKLFGIPVSLSEDVPVGEFRLWARWMDAPVVMRGLPSEAADPK